jgi:hypothetical protein
MMNSEDTNPDDRFSESRLSDRILFAMELALAQEDVETADTLRMALEKSITRNTGGGVFIERRDYPARAQKAFDKLFELKANAQNQ